MFQASQPMSLLEEYKEVSKPNIGLIPQVPYSIKENVKRVERLERSNIITKVEHSAWGIGYFSYHETNW